MSTVIDSLERAQLRRLPTFGAGDRVRVKRVPAQSAARNARIAATPASPSFGVGVERTFPLHSPKIDRIEVAARGDVRRAKLYYLRGRVGKRARVRERRNTGPEEAVQRELLYGPTPEAEEQAPEEEALAQEAPEEEALAHDAEPAEAGGEAEAEGEAATGASEEAGGETEASATGESEEAVPPTAPQDAGPASEENPAGEEQV